MYKNTVRLLSGPILKGDFFRALQNKPFRVYNEDGFATTYVLLGYTNIDEETVLILGDDDSLDPTDTMITIMKWSDLITKDGLNLVESDIIEREEIEKERTDNL
jgi:hypothetical protein